MTFNFNRGEERALYTPKIFLLFRKCIYREDYSGNFLIVVVRRSYNKLSFQSFLPRRWREAAF